MGRQSRYAPEVRERAVLGRPVGRDTTHTDARRLRTAVRGRVTSTTSSPLLRQKSTYFSAIERQSSCGRQPHPRHQLNEPRVRAKRIEHRIAEHDVVLVVPVVRGLDAFRRDVRQGPLEQGSGHDRNLMGRMKMLSGCREGERQGEAHRGRPGVHANHSKTSVRSLRAYQRSCAPTPMSRGWTMLFGLR